MGGRAVILSVVWLVGALPAIAAAQRQPARATGCETCHTAQAEPRLAQPVLQFRDDVHRERGFSCVDCHGGDPSTDVKARAKDQARRYRGKPTGQALIEVCARCHSDAAFMRQYAPRQRVDQASEYATSVHGQRLADGDSGVATCASCHGAHGIRQVSDARSPVFPLNVVATCARCHSDADHMKNYQLPGGSPLPTNQRAEYEKSVHFEALTKRTDLSAPTCNDCHGNHGAAPPGVGTVANVCGTCHAVFASRFERSVHRDIFERGCAECHENHAVGRTSDEMLGTTEKATCAACHSEGDNGFAAAGRMRAAIERLKAGIDSAGRLIDGVKNDGIEVSTQELALREARSRLTVARTEMHAFDPAAVDPAVKEGLDIVATVDTAGQAALAELRFRRRGLAASLVAILIVVVALAWKVRELDRRQGAS